MDPEKKVVINDVEFENNAVDPGFTTDDSKIVQSEEDLKGKSLKNIENSPGTEGNDALNYKNDRENGAFNPKNI